MAYSFLRHLNYTCQIIHVISCNISDGDYPPLQIRLAV